MGKDRTNATSEMNEVISTGKAARFTGWNLAGSILPMIAALFAFPALLHGLGRERFGLLSLIWMIVGYFGILDLGLGRALTKMTAQWIGQRRHEELPSLFWTSIAMMILMGILGSFIIFVSTPWLVNSALNIQENLQGEAIRAFRAVCFGLPIIILSVGLVGVLEAHHKFAALNLIRIPMGTFTFLGPLCVLPFSTNLVPVVGVLVAGRVVACALYFILYIRCCPAVIKSFELRKSLIPALLGFGGWMTVSNLLLPLMIHIDRYLIGAWASVAVVAFYVIPAEMVVKLLIIPRAWISVLFPSFAAHYESKPLEVSALFCRGVKYLLLGMFPIILAIIVFAREGLLIWLGPEMAANGAVILQLLAAGMYLYGLVYVPYLFLQSIGRPDISARIHLAEFPVYLGSAYILIHAFGILGAALAWLVRVGMDIVLMYAFALKHLQVSRKFLIRAAIITTLFLAFAFAVCLIPSVYIRIVIVLVFVALFSILFWTTELSPQDRRFIINCLPASVRKRLFGSDALQNRDKPRVCLVISTFYPFVGGGETHARLLSCALKIMGCEVSVITRRTSPDLPVHETVQGLPVTRVRPVRTSRFSKYLMLFPVLAELIRKRKDYDLILVSGLRILSIAAIPVALWFHKACILRAASCGELSGAYIWDSPHKPGMKTAWINRLAKGLIFLRNRLLLKSDHFLAISSAIAEEYRECGVENDRITLINNGTDTKTFKPVSQSEKTALREKLKLTSSYIFAYSGKLNRGKGLEFLLEVWHEFHQKHADAQLVLIGSGGNQFLSCETELRDYAKLHHLESSVVFTGYVENVHEHLQAADVFIFPSENESLSNALIEACACGLPCLASNIGGIPDTIKDGFNGKLLPCRDKSSWIAAMEAIQSNPEEKNTLGANARRRAVDHNSIEAVAGQHLELFRKCVEQ